MTADASPRNRRNRLTAGVWRAAGAMPLALAVLAEAAWVSIVAALDIAVLVLFVVAGLGLSRLFGLRFGGRWPAAALALSLAAAGAGVLIAPASSNALAGGGLSALGVALGLNPGGVLAGLALLRGIAWGHAGLPLPEQVEVRTVEEQNRHGRHRV